MRKSGFENPDAVKCDGDFLVNSVKRSSLLTMQISTRYLQFGQSAGIGKISGHWEGRGPVLLRVFLPQVGNPYRYTRLQPEIDKNCRRRLQLSK